MRCRACDVVLDDGDVVRPEPDCQYCSICRYPLDEEYATQVASFDHEDLTDIPLDGTILHAEEGAVTDFFGEGE